MGSLADFGSQIAHARKEKSLTQVQLARLAGLSRATVDALENARTTDTGASRLIRILGVLGLELVVRPATQQRPTLEELLEESVHD
jgi:transcriptional regulator with XRE-family HTH domain